MSEGYNPKSFEAKWQQKWAEAKLFEAADNADRSKNKYILDMFPYPSGDGLHVGHVESYTGTDILSRYYRMRGYNVMHPIGWDAFGLPAENYAIKKGVHPNQTTQDNIRNFTRQINSMGFSYDWSREVNTSSQEYYRWTQWLFIKLYEKGLAYKKKAKVNWCESCKTVLANEQVVNGNCERCGNTVIQKDLAQWFFKVTDYAERLLQDLEGLDWPEHIKLMQHNWIGKSNGAELTFALSGTDEKLRVFTTRPDTLYGATYVVMAPEHALVDTITTDENRSRVDDYRQQTLKKSALQRTDLAKEKTGVFTGGYAIHPITSEHLPVWIADYVLAEYGTGAVMAVPAHDERDFVFAKQYNLPIINVISPDGNDNESKEPFIEAGILINSGECNGIKSDEANAAITKLAGGEMKVTYRLRDWLVSRQRYWGAPIPIIYCDKCGEITVPEKDLPVILPDDVDFRPTGESPLVDSIKFHAVTCPKCGGPAHRESDTMDTFVDSSWYFLRYADPKNESVAFDPEKVKAWLPVDVYIGGAEHAVLHLMYARFITKVLCDEGLIDFKEPFTVLRNQGMILGEDSQKMSKSRGNVINPDELVNSHGADALRLYEMFLGPFDQMKAWNSGGIEGVSRFLKRIYSFYQSASPTDSLDLSLKTKKLVIDITEKIEKMQFNTAISSLMEYLNLLPNLPYSIGDLKTFVKLLAPFAPHLTEELWSTLVTDNTFVSVAEWPIIETVPEETEMNIAVQIDGKVRGTIIAPSTSQQENIDYLARQNDKINQYLEGVGVVKIHYVPGRIISYVTKP